MLKCIKILEPRIKDSIICRQEAGYIYEGATFCDEHMEEILQNVGTQVAQMLLQQKLALPQNAQQQSKPKLFTK